MGLFFISVQAGFYNIAKKITKSDAILLIQVYISDFRLKLRLEILHEKVNYCFLAKMYIQQVILNSFYA